MLIIFLKLLYKMIIQLKWFTIFMLFVLQERCKCFFTVTELTVMVNQITVLVNHSFIYSCLFSEIYNCLFTTHFWIFSTFFLIMCHFTTRVYICVLYIYISERDLIWIKNKITFKIKYNFYRYKVKSFVKFIIIYFCEYYNNRVINNIVKILSLSRPMYKIK